MKTLKIFRGNYDGRNERAVVCYTKKEAIQLLGIRLSHLNSFFCPRDNQIKDEKEVWDSPHVAFQRKMSFTFDKPEWEKIKKDA